MSIQFQQAQGDLDFAIYDANAKLVGYSNGTGNSESVSLSALNAGTYYVYVYGYGGASNPHYTLTVTPGRTKVDGRFEPNNSLAAAADLGSLSIARTEQNQVMADAGDCYKFSNCAVGTSTRYVGLGFQHTDGDLDVELLNACGQRVGLSQGVSNTESISMAGSAAVTYYDHVHGYSGTTHPNYSLTIAPSWTSNPIIPTANPPAFTPPPTSTPPTTSATPTASGFQIDLQMSGLTASQQVIF